MELVQKKKHLMAIKNLINSNLRGQSIKGNEKVALIHANNVQHKGGWDISYVPL